MRVRDAGLFKADLRGLYFERPKFSSECFGSGRLRFLPVNPSSEFMEKYLAFLDFFECKRSERLGGRPTVDIPSEGISAGFLYGNLI